MMEEINRLIDNCQEFINALYDTLLDMVDKLSDIFAEVYTVHSGAIGDDEYYLRLRLESEKKWKESENQKVFESKINNFKPNKIIKIIQINKRFSPKNWTGKNFKRAV